MSGRKKKIETKRKDNLLFSKPKSMGFRVKDEDLGLKKENKEIKNKKKEVIFSPNPGSQTMFLTCPVFEVLISGTRGSGKTIILIMDFLKDVGVGYGTSWIGVIFRQTYKQLFDVITKTKEWIPKIFPDAVYQSTENRWVFATGEQLLFRYMERPDDYWQYHGWEIPWCVTPDTPILMADNTYKRIGDIRIGDFVMTLMGPREVLNTMVLQDQEVHNMFVVDEIGDLIGVQQQGYSHSVLGTNLDFQNSYRTGQFKYTFCTSHQNEDKLSYFVEKQRPFGVVLYKGQGNKKIPFLHPYYSSKKRISNKFDGSLGGAIFRTVDGFSDMVDLQIQGENHYITKLKKPKQVPFEVLAEVPFFHDRLSEFWHFQDKDNKYSVQDYCVINKNCGWEELTNFPVSDMYDSIKSICRSPREGMPKRYRSTTNPYGVGAPWVKARFIDVAPPCEIYTDEEGYSRCWIDSHISENEPLMKADPHYLSRITSSMADKARKIAWTTGSWEISVGGIFSDSWDVNVHKIEPFEIPKSWYVDVTYDYGSSKPFAVCFFAECTNDEEVEVDGVKRSFVPGTLFHIMEYYGWTGKPDEGLRLNVTEVAKNIRDLIDNHYILKDLVVHPGPADNAIFTSEANMPSIALRMLRFKDNSGVIRKGVKWRRSNKKPGSRKIGVELFRDRLEASKKIPQEEPGFFVFSICKNFLRTVPFLPRDNNDPDDVCSDAEDHIWDAVRYRILSRKSKTTSQEI